MISDCGCLPATVASVHCSPDDFDSSPSSMQRSSCGSCLVNCSMIINYNRVPKINCSLETSIEETIILSQIQSKLHSDEPQSAWVPLLQARPLAKKWLAAVSLVAALGPPGPPFWEKCSAGVSLLLGV